MAKDKKINRKPVIENRQAKYNYKLLESFEAGISLLGWEVKSIRASSLELKVGAVDDIEVIIENSDANSEDFIVSKNKWEKYKGNYIQIMLDDSDWLQSIQTKNTNLVDNDEVAYEYEVLGSRFIKIDHLGQDKSAMIVTGILKWRNGLVAAANFRIVKGMSFLASLNSYSIDLIGFAKVSMTLREYDHNENL